MIVLTKYLSKPKLSTYFTKISFVSFFPISSKIHLKFIFDNCTVKIHNSKCTAIYFHMVYWTVHGSIVIQIYSSTGIYPIIPKQLIEETFAFIWKATFYYVKYTYKSTYRLVYSIDLFAYYSASFLLVVVILFPLNLNYFGSAVLLCTYTCLF